MAITAHFGADFAAFKTAVDQADLKLKGFQDDANKVQASLNRVGNAFSGQKIISDATLATKAINDMGGATKLTDKEQAALNATLNEAIAKYKALGQSAPKSMTDLADATKQGSNWVQTLGKDILSTAAGFVTAQAVIAGIKTGVRAFADEVVYLTMHGSAVSDVTSNFEHLAEQSGRLGSTLVGELRAGTHATISDFDLIKLATQDLAAGLNLTDQQFGTLAKGAFALAQATGTDVKTALDTMNDAMLTGRTRALALLTGKIDLEKAETAFARSLGTTRDHLSEEGKLEAARAATLDAVSAATSRLGAQVDGLDERVQQAQASWTNFHNELARVVADSPVLATAFTAVSDALAEAFGVDKKDLITSIAAEIDRLAIVLVDFAKFGAQALGDIYKSWLFLKQTIISTQIDISNLRRLWILWQESAMLASGDFANYEKLEKQLKTIGVEMEQRRADAAALTAQMNDADGATGKWVQSLDEIQDKMRAAQASHHDFGAAMDALSAGTTRAAAANRALGASATGATSGLLSEKAAAADAAKASQKVADGYKAQMAASKTYYDTLDMVEKVFNDNKKEYAKQQVAIAEATAKKQLDIFIQLNNSLISLDSERTRKLLAINAPGAPPNTPTGPTNQSGTLGSQFGRDFTDGLKGSLSSFGPALVSALEGGGNVIKSVAGAMGQSFTSHMFGEESGFAKVITKNFSGALGDMINAVLPGIGALLGPLIDKIAGFFKHIFGGPSKAELAGRSATDEFVAGLQSALTAVQSLEVHQLIAAGNSAKWAQEVVGLRQAYLLAGATSEEAASKASDWTTRLWEAEKKGGNAVALLIDQINLELGQMSDQSKTAKEEAEKAAAAAEATKREFDDMVASFDGSKIFHDADVAVRAIEQLGGITGLTKDETERLYQMLQKAVEKYVALGQDAPEALLAIFRATEMARTSTDKATESIGRYLQKIEDADSLTGQIKDAFGNPVPKQIIEQWLKDNPGDWRRIREALSNWTDPNAPEGFAFGSRGGFVTDKGIQYFGYGGNVRGWMARGSDRVPAMLTPGEGILSRRGMAALSRLNSGQADGGGISISIGSITCNASEAEIAAAVISEMRRKGVRFRAA